MKKKDFALLEAGDGKTAVTMAQTHRPDLVLLDINLPEIDGLSALQAIRKEIPDAVVIVFTAYGTSERAIEAMKAGAYDYLEKPFDLDEFLLIVRRSLQYRELLREVQHLRTQVTRQDQSAVLASIVGTSGKMQEIFKQIGRVARTDTTVLIQGESGTGKELIADALQRHSPRKDRPFIKVNCGALPERLLESEMFGHERGAFTGAVALHPGRFELADGGTLFLDEVNAMTPSLQVKLLRALQNHKFERVGGKETLTVDVRVIAATNKNLEREVKEGHFREDLYYRLEHPPHHDSSSSRTSGRHPGARESLPREVCPRTHGASLPDVSKRLREYDWPGNVRGTGECHPARHCHGTGRDHHR